MDIIKTLESVGLNSAESRVYIVLVELKEAKTGMICQKAGIASSNIYNVLENLIKIGLVSYRLKNNVKIFMPSAPEILEELFNEKQKKVKEEGKELMKLMESLRQKTLEKEPYSNYKYYEGLSGLKSLWTEILENAENNSVAKTFVKFEAEEHPLRGFFTDWHKNRIKKKIKIEMIFPKGSSHGMSRSKLPLTNIKFLDYSNSEAEWGIIGEYIYLEYAVSKNPRGFLIKDSIFTQTFRVVFDQLWKIAKS